MTEQVTLIPGGIDSRRQHDITMPAAEGQKLTLHRIDPKNYDFVIYGAGKPLITIKPSGEMEVHDAQEACLLLQAEWNKMRGVSS